MRHVCSRNIVTVTTVLLQDNVARKEFIMYDYISIFEDTLKMDSEVRSFQDLFFKEDEHTLKETLDKLLPRINTLMEHMMWIFQNPRLFDRGECFYGSLCSIRFKQVDDDTKVLTIGDTPLYLKADRTGYHLCVNNKKISPLHPIYLRFDKETPVKQVTYTFLTQNRTHEDMYKSILQIHTETLWRFLYLTDDNYDLWEKEILYHIETALDRIKKKQEKMVEICVYEDFLEPGRPNEFEQTLEYDATFGVRLKNVPGQYISCKTTLSYDVDKDLLTVGEITIGESGNTKVASEDVKLLTDEITRVALLGLQRRGLRK